MTTTKVGFPRATSPHSGVVPFGSIWEVVTSANRRAAAASLGADLTTVIVGRTENLATSPLDRLIDQYQIPVSSLTAGSIMAGTFTYVMRCYEQTSGIDSMLQVMLRVTDAAGTTEKGVLYAGQTATTVSADPAQPNGEMATTQQVRALTNIALSAVSGLVGTDLVIIEIGYRNVNTSTTTTTTNLTEGAVTSLGWLPNTIGYTSDGSPWIEFNLTDAPGTPTGLTADPDFTSIDLDWTASTGAPTGYEVRVNGGGATDVGNVLTHNFTGLTPDTAYTLEVRAYNAGGYSAWATIGSTTDGPPDDPTGLGQSTTITTATLTWVASTGSPAGYDVRIDGGAALDVGNVLTYDFTGLTPGTLYTLEVRAYNAGGDSGWASIAATTTAAGPGYTADIDVGDHSWSIESGDPAAGAVLVLDGMDIGWSVGESSPWPAQPNPVGATVRLWTEDVAEMDDVVIGTPVSIVLTDVSTQVFGTFHGRVASQNAVAKLAGPNGLGMLYTLTAVDYTVDLAELPLTVPEEWPAESGAARFARIVDAIAVQGGVTVDPPADVGAAAFAALTPGATTALALLAAHLDQVAVDFGEGPQRYVVVPVVTAGVLERFTCALVERTVDASLLPGTLELVDGLLTLTFPNDNADGVVPAGAVELEAPWNRLKYRAVNQVIVTGDAVSATAILPGPPVRLGLTTTLTDQDAADLMAALYLPDVDETNGWVADSFRLHAVDPDYDLSAPQALTPAWLPDHRQDPATTTVYVMPMVVRGIPVPINLAGGLEVYAGQLVQAGLVLDRQRVLMDFALRRQLPAQSGAESVTWEWVLDNYPTLTWEDVDPALSWYDTRLARI